MDAKKLKSLERRIKNANNTFAVMGAMMLALEFQGMSTDELLLIKNHITLKNLNSQELSQELNKRAHK